MRTPLTVANWKMNTSLEEAQALLRSMLPELSALTGVDTVICPPLTWLVTLASDLAGSRVSLGAQNMYFEERGAFTGEVSPRMLKGICDYILVGQYERRIHFGETNWLVRRKTMAAQEHGFTPILCVGDTIDQREEGAAGAVVAQQLEAGLEGVNVDSSVVVAYDPPWTTMGKAMPPPPEYVNDMCGHIRDTLSSLFSADAASQVRVIYGGSITIQNIAALAEQPELDGVLVGAASLSAQNFVAIARTLAEVKSR